MEILRLLHKNSKSKVLGFSNFEFLLKYFQKIIYRYSPISGYKSRKNRYYTWIKAVGQKIDKHN